MHPRDKAQGCVIWALVIATPFVLIWGGHAARQKLADWWSVVVIYFAIMTAFYGLVKFFDWRSDRKVKKRSVKDDHQKT
jgi:hypothetical protein